MNPRRNRAECVGYCQDPGFVSFPADEIEQTIPDRFRKQVEKYPDRLAVKTADVAVAASYEHFELLRQMGCQAADLHCGAYQLLHTAVAEFRGKFARPGG